MTTISELVNDAKLSVHFSSHCFSHEVFDPGVGRARHRLERWRRQRCLGRGAYGTVYLERCLDEERPKLRAVKVVPKTSHSSHAIDYTRELEAMVKFSQRKYARQFVNLLGWFEDPGFVYIAMEYLELGDLQRYLARPLPETEARQIAFQVLEALQHLHDNGFAHRDLKPSNILVVRAGPDWWVKIGDFGVSKRVRDGKTVFRTVAGTPGYIAPEVLKGQLGAYDDDADPGYTQAADIWSLGVLTHFVLTSSLPFGPSRPLAEYVQTGQFPCDVSQVVSPEAVEFMRALMAVEPSHRLPAKEALRHLWMDGLSEISFGSTEWGAYDNAEVSNDLLKFPHPSLESSDYSRSWGEPGTTTPEPPQVTAATSKIFQQGTEARETAVLKPTSDPTISEPTRLTNEEIKPFPSDTTTAQHPRDPEDPEMMGYRHMYWHGRQLIVHHKFSEAEQVLKEAYAGFVKRLGPMHETTLSTIYQVSRALKKQCKLQAAEEWGRRAYEGHKTALGPQHAFTLHDLNSLGIILGEAKKYAGAEEALSQAYRGFEITLGPLHERTLSALFYFGKTLQDQKKFADAAQIFKKVYEAECQVVGPTHRHTILAKMNLVRSLELQRQIGKG
ncbi:kinase-like domain-containing protein [Aspergillus egyptiacus]|nr:kinase-like domain-containing protein [Aspergillus egyptiacus]